MGKIEKVGPPSTVPLILKSAMCKGQRSGVGVHHNICECKGPKQPPYRGATRLAKFRWVSRLKGGKNKCSWCHGHVVKWVTVSTQADYLVRGGGNLSIDEMKSLG